MADIKLENITKRYPDGYEAVKDMTLEIEDGEFVILVGPSGCGKSTALRMIAGLEDISDGELRIGGDVVNDKAPRDRDIAMVFQNYALYPHMTVEQNIGFGMRLRRTPKPVMAKRVGGAPRSWACSTTWPASRPTCPGASASGWPSAGPWSGSPRPS